mgnify:FL=1
MNKKLTAIGGLAALAVVGGTWAFFTQDTTIHNKLTTDGMYGLNTTEKFNPGSEWAPGTEVEKKITVKNTGTGAVLVRVKMDENWAYKGTDTLFREWASEKDPLAFLEVSERLTNEDGNPLNDFSTVVHKNLDEANIQLDAVAKQDKWYLAEDGYWYFCDKLEGGEATVNLLNSIKLDEKTDMGLIANKYYYIVVGKDVAEPEFDAKIWAEMNAKTEEEAQKELAEIAAKEENKNKDIYMTLETKTDENAKGYSDAGYTLNITTEAVQATPDAVEAEWTTAPAELMENILK